MSYTLDGATSDQYQYLNCPGSNRVTLQISNATVLAGFGIGTRGDPAAAVYGNDESFLPIVGGITRRCDAIRIKSKVAGTPAVFTLTAT